MPGPYLNQGIFRTRITSTNTDAAQEELGVWRYEAGKVLRYVKASALIPAGEPVVIDTTVTTAALIGQQVLQVSSLTGIVVGIAEVTLPLLGFGWVTAYGPATARVQTSSATAPANAGSVLGASSTTGVLSVWGTSNMNAIALAVQTGLSAGSAVFVTCL